MQQLGPSNIEAIRAEGDRAAWRREDERRRAEALARPAATTPEGQAVVDALAAMQTAPAPPPLTPAHVEPEHEPVSTTDPADVLAAMRSHAGIRTTESGTTPTTTTTRAAQADPVAATLAAMQDAAGIRTTTTTKES